MYFGNDNPNLYTSLLVFMHGFLSGQGEIIQHHCELPVSFLVPSDFEQFVARHFHYKGLGMGWRDLIPRHADGEQAAFELFFELVTAYDRQHQPEI